MGHSIRIRAVQGAKLHAQFAGAGIPSRLAALSCPVCCSFHVDPTQCPGELHATGPEQRGWRVNVNTPSGIEAYGVLLAPSHELWRARIITFPNVLWMAPGGWGSLKFYGATAEEAESHAIGFVDRHCTLNGYERRDGMDVVQSRRGDIQVVAALKHGAKQIHPRKVALLPLRFGKSRPATLGQSLNISQEGLFIGTPLPIPRGEACSIALHVQGTALSLQGIVMWNRPRMQAGAPLGMGVRLFDPPAAYTKYVITLP